MRLGDPGAHNGPRVGDLAAALNRGVPEARSLISPLLPAVYAYLARRSADPEEAEEALGDALLLARGRVRDPRAAPLPLLPWLLAAADGALRSRIGHADPDAEAGLAAGRGSMPVRIRSGLAEALPRLRRPERLALGMRFADRLPAETVAAALRRETADVRADLVRALAHVAAESYPGRSIPYPDPVDLDGYVDRVLAGDPGERPASVGEEVAEVANALQRLPAATQLTPRAADRVWRRFEDEAEEYLPGRPLPVLPAWLRTALGGALMAAVLAGAGLWFVGSAPPEAADRAADAARPGRAAAEPARTPTASIDTAEDGESAAGPPADAPEPRPAWTPGTDRGFLGELTGTLYYVRPGARATLMRGDLGRLDGSGQPGVLLTAAGSQLRYAVSPTDGSIAYSTPDGLALWDAELRTSLPLVGPLRGDAPGETAALSVRAAAWHPQGHTLALVTGGAAEGRERLWTYTPGLDSPPGALAYALEPRDRVSSVAWSPSGDSLLLNTARGAVVVSPPGMGRRRTGAVRLRLDGKVASWSPEARPERLVWIEKMWPGTNAPFGVVDPDGRRSTTIGQAASVSWQPGGERLLYARHRSARSGPGRPVGASVWQYELATGEDVRLSELPEMDASVGEVEWAPDGMHLALATRRGVLVANAYSGETAPLPGPAGPVRDLTWWSDPAAYTPPPPRLGEPGTIFYLEDIRVPHRATQQNLMLLDPETGAKRSLYSGTNLEYAVSPFHTKLAVSRAESLEMLDLESGAWTRLRQYGGREGRATEVAWLPSGRELVYLEEQYGPYGGYSRTRLVRHNIHTGARRVLLRRSYAEAPTDVALSPSGRWLLLETAEGWSLLPAAGGTPRALPPAIGYEWRPDPAADQLLRVGLSVSVVDVRGRRLGPLLHSAGNARWLDAGRIALMDNMHRLVLYDVETRRRTVTRMRVADDLSFGAFSPSGRWILQSTLRSLWAYDTRTGRREWVATGPSGFYLPRWIPYRVSVPAAPDAPPAPARDPGGPALYWTESSATGSRSSFQTLWARGPGGRPKRLARVSGFDVSPGGGRVLYVDPDGLWIHDVRTNRRRLALPFEDGVADPYTRLSAPRWSPDGRRVSFLVIPRTTVYAQPRFLSRGAYIFDPARRGRQPLRPLGAERGFPVAARWSAAGDQLLVSSLVRTTVYDAGGLRQAELPLGQLVQPLPSPVRGDASLLLLDLVRGREAELKLRRASGRTSTLSGAAHASLWAPDGGAAYFLRGGDLWAVSRDGTHRWRVAAGLPRARDAASPAWTPDGRYSYASGAAVYAVDLDTGRVRTVLRWRDPIQRLAWGFLPAARP